MNSPTLPPLDSWKPRRPSARLKDRLFRQAAPAPHFAPAPLDASTARRASGVHDWPWLAPALALFVLGLFVAGPRLADPPGPPSGDWTGLFQPTNASDKTLLVAVLAEEIHSPHNHLQAASFEWTNGPRSLTTSAPQAGTNSLVY